MEKYILVEGPVLEEFMALPNFHEECFLAGDGEIGFVPQRLFNIVMYGKN